jgi:membrane protein required for colicin V production
MMDELARLTWIDWTLLAIVFISLIFGMVRGVVREFFSLLGWVLAFWLAISFSQMAAQWLAPFISSETIRLMASFVMLFLAGLIFAGALGYFMNAVAASVGLGTLNRVLGAAFGLLRGWLFVVLLVMLAGMTSFPTEKVWKSSIFVEWGVRSGKLLTPYLPTRMAERIHF